MNYYEMQPGVYYEVRRKSSDGTFTFGMVIRKDRDGSVDVIRLNGGWFDAEDFNNNPKMADFDAKEFEWPFGEGEITKRIDEPDERRKFTNLSEAIRFYAQAATVSLYNLECDYRRKQSKRVLPKDKTEELFLHVVPAGVKDNMQVSIWLHELAYTRAKLAKLEIELNNWQYKG